MFFGRRRLWKPGAHQWKATTIRMLDFVPVDMPMIRVIYATQNRLIEEVSRSFSLPMEAVSCLKHENKIMLGGDGGETLYFEIEDMGPAPLEEMLKVAHTER